MSLFKQLDYLSQIALLLHNFKENVKYIVLLDYTIRDDMIKRLELALKVKPILSNRQKLRLIREITNFKNFMEFVDNDDTLTTLNTYNLFSKKLRYYYI